jgi:hypothetical protein
MSVAASTTLAPPRRPAPAPPPSRPPSAGSVAGPTLRDLVVACALAATSLALVAPAPSYDPWAWLLWGREITELRLSTAEGPAFKPLPVAICALLAPLGDSVAPVAWVLLARVGAALAVLSAFHLARRLSGGSRAAGALAAVGVAMTGPFLAHAASGLSEPLLVALALTGIASARAGRPRAALACGAACALIRVETWPFLAVAALLAWRRDRELRLGVALVAAVIPLAWFGPELLGSGDLLRSSARARVPNPGQPALAPLPALASLTEAVALLPWLLWLGVASLLTGAIRPSAGRRAALSRLTPALLGGAWLVVVAVMAQVGFSGEPRYALPGATLIAISGAVGVVAWVRGPARRALAPALVVAAVAVLLADRRAEVEGIPAAQAHHWRLTTGLRAAIEGAGGRQALLACGTPYVGPYRGTLAAYQLDVAKHVVEPDLPPHAPGVVLASRLKAGSPVAPRAPEGFTSIAAGAGWTVLAGCARTTN